MLELVIQGVASREALSKLVKPGVKPVKHHAACRMGKDGRVNVNSVLLANPVESPNALFE